MIPRYNIRGRNRSGSTKSSSSYLAGGGNQTSNYNFGRSSSFRVNRSTSGTIPSQAPNEYCKHIKYCCLHQNFNSARNVIEEKRLEDRSSKHMGDFNRMSEDEDRRIGASNSSLGNRFNLNEFATFSNFCDDEKTMKYNNKFVVKTDSSQQLKQVSQQQPFESTTSFTGEYRTLYFV